MIKRYSSLRQNLNESFLQNQLNGALKYDRIAGYFSSSLLEIAGEAIESIKGEVRIICNSELAIEDVQSARHAAMAMGKEWKVYADGIIEYANPNRFELLAKYLHSGKLNIKVLPNSRFGLIHGKAGVITLIDGSKTAFMGSVNESVNGWQRNYELLWEDRSDEGIKWVEEEFHKLWFDAYARPLASVVFDDVVRISKRQVISIENWKKEGNAAATVVESPVSRSEFGLWAHQKYFIHLAYQHHLSNNGARFVLADMVGLGKTVQLAAAAQLMTLSGGKPVLVIAPKNLIWQWQDELKNLLNIPSAVWNGKQWVDENELIYPNNDPISGIKSCPRRFGIVSQGLITSGNETIKTLLNISFECVIVDECHRARRKNLKKDGEEEKAVPNNLMDFIAKIAHKTKSLLLATATPVQLYPIEAYDLLSLLACGNDHVLGNAFSRWRSNKKEIFNWITGKAKPQLEDEIFLEYIRNPFPPASEDERTFGHIRRYRDLLPAKATLELNELTHLRPTEKKLLLDKQDSFFEKHNPYLRHIIRRTRNFLENEIDPSTGETYLKKVEVKLFGEDEKEAILLEGTLLDAYQKAEEYCLLLSRRSKSAGFLKTLLLKRMGSSITAGKNTTQKLLSQGDNIMESELEDENTFIDEELSSPTQSPSIEEMLLLKQITQLLEQYKSSDPKYLRLKSLLNSGHENSSKPWRELGCILFSQYFDTAKYMAERYSMEHENQLVGLYAGGNKSGVYYKGIYTSHSKEQVKRLVREGTLRILFGTDAASEGLNLQRLSTLINIDLPWNPTRLEQRKGRIQRIGQMRDEVYIYNMRYKDSVEDRVHKLLSERLKSIHELFGQIPDVLEDVWVHIALGDKQEALKLINAIPKEHPFELRYNRIENMAWERFELVLNEIDKLDFLKKLWTL